MNGFKVRVDHLIEKIEGLYGLLDKAVAAAKDIVESHEKHVEETAAAAEAPPVTPPPVTPVPEAL